MTLLFSSMNEQPVIDIDIAERGLAYGDGHFTTAKISEGKIEHLALHIARLEHAHHVLGLAKTVAEIDSKRLRAYLTRVSVDYDMAVIKVIITSGAGGRGYARTGLDTLNIYVQISPFPQQYNLWQEQGLHIGLGQFVLSSNPSLAGLKHLNRLEQVLIKDELEQRDEQDILLCDQGGHVIEASSANVFWFKNDQWYTPDLSASGVDGVYRQFILSKIDDIHVGHYSSSELENVETMFICNSLMEVMPIAKYKSVPLSIAPINSLREMLK